MDKAWISSDRLSDTYEVGINIFLDFAQSTDPNLDLIRCPCIHCINLWHHSIQTVCYHLFAYGFDESYKVRSFHGERQSKLDSICPNKSIPPDFDYTRDMLHDAFRDVEKKPDSLKSLLEECEKPLYVGSKYNALSGLLKFQHIKGQFGWSEASFEVLLGALKDVLPLKNRILNSLYDAKKLLKGVGLQYEKSHACENDYVLFWKEHKDAYQCPTCGTSRSKKNTKNVPSKVLWYFPPIPRFRRMFSSPEMVQNLTWHAQGRANNGPKQPSNNIGVYLAPLIADLKLLWETGMKTYDAYKKEYFNLRAILLWNINDFPAYGNLSGCVTKGEDIYDYLTGFETSWGKKTTSKKKTSKKKTSKKKTTLLNLPGKTKDGLRARQDLEAMGIKPELQTQQRGNRTWLPPACYTLNTTKKHQFYETLSTITMSDGYCSNFKNLVSDDVSKMNGLKSNDCHVLMQQLLPFAIKGVLHVKVRKTIIGLCHFFNVLCSKVVDVNKLGKLQSDIVLRPSFAVKKYSGFAINEYRFHTTSRDESRTTQCSRVSLVAHAMQIASAKDSNPVRGIKKDDFGFTMVNFARLDHQSERFILASQAKQVFYVQDQQDANLSVVGFTPHKMYKYGANGETDDMLEYHMNFELDPRSRKNTLQSIGTKWKNFKHYLYKKFIEKFKNDPNANLPNPPEMYPYLKIDEWKVFLSQRLSKKWEEISQKAKKMCRQHRYNRRLSRKGYAGLTLEIEEMQKPETLGEVSCGTNDMLTQALGTQEQRGHVRGMGKFVRRHQYFVLPNTVKNYLDGEKKKIEKMFNQIEGAIEKLQKGMNHAFEGASCQGMGKADFEDKLPEELLDTSCYLAIDIASNIVGKGTIVKHNDLSGENIEVMMEMSVQGDALLPFPLDEEFIYKVKDVVRFLVKWPRHLVIRCYDLEKVLAFMGNKRVNGDEVESNKGKKRQRELVEKEEEKGERTSKMKKEKEKEEGKGEGTPQRKKEEEKEEGTPKRERKGERNTAKKEEESTNEDKDKS
ncbi:hypothetical protein F3Y22_tig00005377pilonHSYRG00070 [Hibiscus syriacus]|uniref:Transposase-associated domain-containing protein n=1 Tax=Hibiscus syriacus TaxID=106335 RepID=A0A6A3CKG3_HIBSY|nr:hypothetical protein F3Y22_tig00005377pilonHSYRG00070 [Hibiscus syriacus]